MSIFSWLTGFFKKPESKGSPEPVVVEPYITIQERARNEKGQYIPDDPDTPDVNEAYRTVSVLKQEK